MGWRLREATAADAETMALTLAEGFEGYRAFAPPGWRPPPPETDSIRARLAAGDWALMAESERGEPAGHVALMPAALHDARPSDEPGLGHLWQLFVREPWWGTGLASELHTRMLDEAARRGFRSLRLFAAVPQGRARRFYERGGPALAGVPFDDFDFGMPLLEYRRAISIRV